MGIGEPTKSNEIRFMELGKAMFDNLCKKFENNVLNVDSFIFQRVNEVEALVLTSSHSDNVAFVRRTWKNHHKLT